MSVAPLIVLLIAQAAAATPPPDARTRAQALLKEGARFYEKGALVPALEKFQAAYAEYPSAKLLFNIGQASRDLGRPVDAMNAFERFLSQADDAPAETVEEAKRSVAELEGKLGKLQIQCATEDAEISVDGKRVGSAPLPGIIWAEPGHHQVIAQREGFVPAVEEVDVNANWVHTVVVNLQPIEATLPAPVRPAAATSLERRKVVDLPAPRPEARRAGYTWAWVASGSAVVLGGTAVVLGASMRSKFDSLNKSCGSASPGFPGCSESDIETVLVRRNLANVSWGLAAAAAVTAGILFVVEGREVAVAPLTGDATGLVARMAY